MARRKRVCLAGEVFNVLNRAVARLRIFEKPAADDAFLRVLHETWQIVPLPIVALVAMPNHWHFVVRPTHDDQVSDFFRRLTVMHTRRYHAHDKTAGTGHVYQGRFKSFPIQSDEHLLIVMRSVERNPVRANFVDLAEEWQWGSAHARQQSADKSPWLTTFIDPPLPRQWRSWVNKAETDDELKSLRTCIQRGLPFGDDRWIKSSTVRLSLGPVSVHLAYNLVRHSLLQAAFSVEPKRSPTRSHSLVPRNEPSEGKRSARQYSFCAAQQFLTGTWLTAATHPGDLTALIELRLTHLTSHPGGDRPNRIEPRAIKRRPTSHDLLTKPRAAARTELLAACSS